MVVEIFKRHQGDIRNSSCYRTVKLLAHEMKVVERGLEKSVNSIVTANEMQSGFIHETGTFDAVFMARGLQEEYHAKRKT